MNGLIEPKQTGTVKSPAPVSGEPGGIIISAVNRLGLPVLLFGLVFLAGTMVLSVLITPDRFPVRIGDKVIRVRDLEQEEKALRIRQAGLEDARSKLDQEDKSPILHEVARIKKDILPVGSILSRVDDVRRSFADEKGDPISFPGVETESDTVKISGSVKDAQGRSRDLLTRFIDRLRAAGLEVSEPEYQQDNLPDGGSVSPFSISVKIKNG